MVRSLPKIASRPDTGPVLNRLGFPSIDRHRRFVTAIGIDALGSGVWMPLSVLYFTLTTDLGLVRVGAALTVGAAFSLPVSLVAGSLVDRYGARRTLLGANLLQAAGFLLYPAAETWWAVTLAVSLAVMGRTAFWGSYAPLVALVSEPGEREIWFGFLSALRNAGFALGGLAAGAAITSGSTLAFHLVALGNAASFLLSFVLVMTSDVARTESVPRPPRTGSYAAVLRDSGYRWLLGANTGYAFGCLVLNVVIPLYVVRDLGLSGWVSAAAYVINTLAIGIGQGFVVRRMTGVRRYALVILAAALMAAGFLMLLLAGRLGTTGAVVVVLTAVLVYTVGEMAGGPVLLALATEAPPAHLRGRYIAVHQLTWNVAAACAPLLYLWLLDLDRSIAWLTLAGIVLLGAACCLPLRRRLPLADARVTNRPAGAILAQSPEVAGEMAGEVA